jgi:hypothetical protein
MKLDGHPCDYKRSVKRSEQTLLATTLVSIEYLAIGRDGRIDSPLRVNQDTITIKQNGLNACIC